MRRLIRTRAIAVATVLAIATTNVEAQIADLSTPVTSAEEADARAYYDYFLKLYTYEARQYKIVKVNAKLLTEAERFRIELFDGFGITVEVDRLSIKKDGQSLRWEGQIVESPMTSWSHSQLGVPEDQFEAVRKHLLGVTILASETTFDEVTRTKYNPTDRAFEETKKKRAQQKGQDVELYNVISKIDILHDLKGPESYVRYILRPFRSDPRYHLLMELDPDRIVPPGRPQDAKSPEIAEKRRKYLQFLESLGEDPTHSATRPEDQE